MQNTIKKDLYMDTELYNKFISYKSKNDIAGNAILRKAMKCINKGTEFPDEPSALKEYRFKFIVNVADLDKLEKLCKGQYSTRVWSISELLRKVLRNFLRSVR